MASHISNNVFFRNTRLVLRKKPAGQLLSNTAHQVEREYTMLRALHGYNTRLSTPVDKRIPVPEPILLCEDNSVIGTPFYIMEFLDGRIFTDSRMPEVSPQDRREWYVNLYITLHPPAFLTLTQLDISGRCPSSIRLHISSRCRSFEVWPTNRLLSSPTQVNFPHIKRTGSHR